MRALLFIAVLCASGCSNDEEPAACPWYQRCGVGPTGGDCGVCDDGDPCTTDACRDGRCRHVPLVDTCSCSPSCSGEDGRLLCVQVLHHGDGGLPEPRGLMDLAVSADERHVYAAARDSGRVVHFVSDGERWHYGAGYDAGRVQSVALATGLVVAAGPTGVTAFVRNEDGTLIGPTMQGPPALGIEAQDGRVVAVDGQRVIRFEVVGHLLEERGAETDPSLAGARRLALTADGHAIVAGFDASAVSAWDITGDQPVRVSVIEGRPGLTNPTDVAVSADGARVFVAGYCDHDVAMLARSPSGELSWETSAYAADGGLGGCKLLADAMDSASTEVMRLLNPAALALSPDESILMMAVPSPTFDVLLFDIADGGLKAVDYLRDQPPFEGVLNISIEPISQIDDPAKLTFPAEHPYSVSLVTGSTRVFGSSLWSNAFGVLDGPSADAFVQLGDGGVSNLLGAYNLDLSPDGRHLYVAPRLVGTLKIFGVDPVTGGLTEIVEPPAPAFGDEAGSVSNVDVAPDGAQVFAIDSMYARVLVYDRDQSDGTLTLRADHALPDCAGRTSFPVGVTASPDGSSVVIADFQPGKSCMVVYSREGGLLSEPVQRDDEELKGVEDFVFTADGTHLYAAAYGGPGAVDGGVVHYLRDPKTGSLELLVGAKGKSLNGAEFVVLSPDERLLFVSSPVVNMVTVFERAADGALDRVFEIKDGAQGSRLEDAAGLAVTPDGAILYVAARVGDAINHFSIAQSGKLTLRSVAQGDGLDWVNGLVLSPDGTMLYSAAVDASAVTVRRVIRGTADGCLGECL